MSVQTYDAAVIGGGLAGLIAANGLAQGRGAYRPETMEGRSTTIDGCLP